jgi:2-methylisocitrate lyase-like PEP mutase family enzyme
MNLRRRMRELIAQPGLTLMPGVYDALSARIVEAAGFECVLAGGYAAIGSMMAEADSGQSNVRDYADHYERICEAVNIPLYVDADTGFGGVHNIRQMVRMFERAGVAGLFIGDQTFPNRCNYLPGKRVVPVEEMLTRIKAALDARRDGDLIICARTDVISVEGLDAAIERCGLFLEAGADYAKAQGVHSAADVRRVVREVNCPYLATFSQAAGTRHISLAELEAAGAAAVSFPSLSLFAAAKAVRDAVTLLRRENSLNATEPLLMPLADYYALVGLNEQHEREQAYERAAAAVVSRRAAE